MPMDPRRWPAFLDSNALDASDPAQRALVDRFNALREMGEANRGPTPYSVRREIEHPNTPGEIKEAYLPEIFTIRTGTTPAEDQRYREIEMILRGSGGADKHAKDARHLADAAKHGGGYFITHDKGILGKREELERKLYPFKIMTLAEYVAMVESYREGKEE